MSEKQNWWLTWSGWAPDLTAKEAERLWERIDEQVADAGVQQSGGKLEPRPPAGQKKLSEVEVAFRAMFGDDAVIHRPPRARPGGTEDER